MVYVAGVGLHRFGRFPDTSLTALGVAATRAALADAGIGITRIDAAFCGCVYGGVAAGHKVLTALASLGIPIVNVEAGCASGGAALALAAEHIRSGRYERVLVLGMEKMPRGMIRSSFFEPWREEIGLAATPAYFALRAQRLMRESDVRLEDLAEVSVRAHAYGAHNPYAMYRTAVTLDEVLASPVVCPPLRRLMLCAPNEGAAAVVLSARPSGRPTVRLAASVLRSHRPGAVLGEHTPLCGLVEDDPPSPTALAADAAFREAGVGPEDVDVVELQDTDSGRYILSAEELGLCRRGEGGLWLRGGAGTPGASPAINPSGGLLSKGEPLGASALAQVVECTWQLRAAAGPRQVPGARVALVHTVGRGANAHVAVLRT